MPSYQLANMIETIHAERLTSAPLLSKVTTDLFDLKIMQWTDLDIINDILIPNKNHQENWEVRFDVMSMILAYLGEL